ncbi:MAG: hypothetical protein EXS06_07550, partial [Planctomycetaceae bacterium]|nr:hypothetical protein [Planctomycetaceae bacterium]
MPTVRFANGYSREFPQGSRLADVAVGVAGGGKKKLPPIAALLDGKTVGLDAPLPEQGETLIEWLFTGDP